MTSQPITLHLQVGETSRRRLLAARQQICIVREMEEDSPYWVTCAVVDPFGPQTDILFYPTWQVFVTPGVIRSFDTVKMPLQQVVQPGYCYTFDGVGIMGQQPAWSKTVIGLINAHRSDPLCAGLCQQLTINNTEVFHAISITDFPYNGTCYFQPRSTIRIFIARGITAGQILPVGILQSDKNSSCTDPGNMRFSDPGNMRSSGPADMCSSDPADMPSFIGADLSVELLSDTTLYFNPSDNCFQTGPPGP